MAKLSRAQKIYVAILLIVGVPWLVLLFGVPIAEYNYGQSDLTRFLSKMTSLLQTALVALALCVFLLQRIGVLPTIKNDSTRPYEFRPLSKLMNLAIWIVVALLLVFFFNLMQDGKTDQKTIDLLLNILPVFILVAVWLFFMNRMSARKKKDLDTGG